MCTGNVRAVGPGRGGLGAVLGVKMPLELRTAVCGCWWPLCSSETEMKPSQASHLSCPEAACAPRQDFAHTVHILKYSPNLPFEMFAIRTCNYCICNTRASEW